MIALAILNISVAYTMKPLVLVLALLFGFLQCKLWFEKGGVSEVRQLRQAIDEQKQENKTLMAQNSVLIAEIKDLKAGRSAVEERARNDLGMITPGEVFYQVVSEPTK